MKKYIFFLVFLILFFIFPEIVLTILFSWIFCKFSHEMYTDFQTVKAKLKTKTLKEVK